MIDWDAILDSAAQHVPARLASSTTYLSELQSIISAPVQNWTDPFGRGYQYEFMLGQIPSEVSLIVEISTIAHVAAVYFARRTAHTDGHHSDECGDALARVHAADLRQRVCSFLEKHSYEIVPYRELNKERRGKLTYHWLFNDPEE